MLPARRQSWSTLFHARLVRGHGEREQPARSSSGPPRRRAGNSTSRLRIERGAGRGVVHVGQWCRRDTRAGCRPRTTFVADGGRGLHVGGCRMLPSEPTTSAREGDGGRAWRSVSGRDRLVIDSAARAGGGVGATPVAWRARRARRAASAGTPSARVECLGEGAQRSAQSSAACARSAAPCRGRRASPARPRCQAVERVQKEALPPTPRSGAPGHSATAAQVPVHHAGAIWARYCR
jgi:hypothetical protein